MYLRSSRMTVCGAACGVYTIKTLPVSPVFKATQIFPAKDGTSIAVDWIPEGKWSTARWYVIELLEEHDTYWDQFTADLGSDN